MNCAGPSPPNLSPCRRSPVPTDTARGRTDAVKFALRAVAWSLGLFGLLRLNWIEAHAVLPFTRMQSAGAVPGSRRRLPGELEDAARRGCGRRRFDRRPQHDADRDPGARGGVAGMVQ